jgi:hypothetical protein
MSSSSTGRVLEKLEQFVLYEEELTEKIEKWANANIHRFQNVSGSDEHPLSHTELHREYCEVCILSIRATVCGQPFSTMKLLV